MPKLKKLNVQTFFDPVYKKHFQILIDEDIDNASRFLDLLITPDTSGKFFVDEDEPNTIKLWFDVWDINTFGHEVAHAVDYVMSLCSVTCDEAKAYYLGFVLENVYELAEKTCN